MSARAARLAPAAGFALALLAGCQDPVHNGDVDALGPEPNNVSPGPLHRPGQPCLTCHGGSGPAQAQFTMGGTIYQTQTGGLVPLSGATVEITDPQNNKFDVQTNTAGNFYVTTSDYQPTYPAHVLVTYNGTMAQMLTHIGRDGSCADCHFDPPGPTTPGHIYLVLSPDAFPGTPPASDGGM
jgi:hypothetical protein